jgi:TonB family protein
MALELEQEGEVQVLVRLNRDGSFAAPPALARSCGHRILDEEALRMVASAAPFPPLPAGYPRPSAELRIPVRFDLPN